jgi:hypothetical protein
VAPEQTQEKEIGMGGNGKVVVMQPRIQVVATDEQGKINEFERNYIRVLKSFLIGRLIDNIVVSRNVYVNQKGQECLQIAMIYGPEQHYLEPIILKFADSLQAKRNDRDISGFELEMAKTLEMMGEMADQKTANFIVSVPLSEVLKFYNDGRYISKLAGYTLTHIALMPRPKNPDNPNKEKADAGNG